MVDFEPVTVAAARPDRVPEPLNGDPRPLQQIVVEVAQPKNEDPSLLKVWADRAAHVRTLVVTPIVFLIALTIFVELYARVTEPTITIEPITAPPSLVAMGYSPEVIAQRLQINLVAATRQLSAAIANRLPGFASNRVKADVSVPGLGISLDAAAELLRRRYFPEKDTRIAGEVVRLSDERLAMRLYVSERSALNTRGQIDVDATDGMDALIAAGADKVLPLTQPYVAAVRWFQDRTKDGNWQYRFAETCELLKNCRVEPPDADDGWCSTLLGVIIARDGTKDHLNEALKYLRDGTTHGAPNWPSHHALGRVLARLHQLDAAREELARATALDADPAKVNELNDLINAYAAEDAAEPVVPPAATEEERQP